MQKNPQSPDRIAGDTTPETKPTAAEIRQLINVIETGLGQIRADVQALANRKTSHYCPMCEGGNDAA